MRRLGVVPVAHDDRHAPAGCAALRPLDGVPLVRCAVQALLGSGILDEVVVAVAAAAGGPVTAALAGTAAVEVTPVEVLSLQDRPPGLVAAVLAAAGLAPDDLVVVHDPLVPLAPAALVRAVVEALIGAAADVTAVVPVRPVTDTLKRLDRDEVITGTVDREGFRTFHSPQAYRAGALVAALAGADDGLPGDLGPDALPLLVQQRGGRLSSVAAPGEVFRVSTADDLVLAEAMLGLSRR